MEALEDSLSPRKPPAPSMRSKCSISAWSCPTAPSSALPGLPLVPRLTWPCSDWKAVRVEKQTRASEAERGGVRVDEMRRPNWPIRKFLDLSPCSSLITINTELLSAQTQLRMFYGERLYSLPQVHPSAQLCSIFFFNMHRWYTLDMA